MNMMEALKCDFCGGRLIMDDSREFATCEMCGTKYMKSTVQQKIQEIRGSVTITGEVSVKQVDFSIRSGVLEKYNGSSTDVIIPNNITHIGDGAFENCKGLKKVSIPDTVIGIGDRAFYGCESLTSIEIPLSVTNIGQSAFENCTNLETVTGSSCIQQRFSAFIGSKWHTQMQKVFMKNNRCRHCGGELRGVFGFAAECLNCGRPKDYGWQKWNGYRK